MAVFKKVDWKGIDGSSVTLAVMKSDDGIIVGRVVAGPIATNAGIEVFSTAPADPPIEDAISIANRYATTNSVAVHVYDPANLWQPCWGELG